jgi:hypothetical protein
LYAENPTVLETCKAKAGQAPSWGNPALALKGKCYSYTVESDQRWAICYGRSVTGHTADGKITFIGRLGPWDMDGYYPIGQLKAPAVCEATRQGRMIPLCGCNYKVKVKWANSTECAPDLVVTDTAFCSFT